MSPPLLKLFDLRTTSKHRLILPIALILSASILQWGDLQERPEALILYHRIHSLNPSGAKMLILGVLGSFYSSVVVWLSLYSVRATQTHGELARVREEVDVVVVVIDKATFSDQV